MGFEIAHIPLRDPYPNGATDKKYFDQIIWAYESIKSILDAGKKVYVGYTTGERAGSIAYIKEVLSDSDKIVPEVYFSHNTWKKGHDWRCWSGFQAVLGWDGRRNAVKCFINHDIVYFPDYEGPTVWEKFDKKAAEKSAAEAAIVLDRDGNILEIGDRVLYINARYGGAACLDRGTISDIKVKVNKCRNDIHSELNVIIDNDNNEQSKITGPNLSVLKI